MTALTRTLRNFFRNLSPQRKVLLLSLVVGIASGGAAVLLVGAISFIGRLVHTLIPGGTDWRIILMPAVGMLLSLLIVKYFAKENIGHGVTRVLVAVSRNESRIKPHNMWTSLASSALTIGFGGSVGAEAPIVYTGAAMGSNFARYCGLSYKNLTILVGCGAAGALAGIFKAPLAGVLFTLEVLLFNISLSSLLPMLISALTAAFVAYIFRGQLPEFVCSVTPFAMRNIPFYLILGIGGALGSVYFTRFTLWLEDTLGKWDKTALKWLVCSIGLGALILVFPMLFGEGYGVVRTLLMGNTPEFGFWSQSPWSVPLVFLMVFLFKVVAMALTNAGGGVGGTFGPTLFAGAVLGFVVARSLNLAGADVPESNFVLVGMAAMMAGVMKSPLTAVFLICELSGGYALMIPVMFTVLVSFGVSRYFEKYSIYTKRIAQSGELLTHDSDQAVVTLMNTSELVRDKYPRISPYATLGELVNLISESNAAVVAVVDHDDRFQGLVNIENVRKYLFDASLYGSLHVYNIMTMPEFFVTEGEGMQSVIKKFEDSDAWRIPVIDKDRKYKGFISKSRIYASYRDILRHRISTED